MECVFGNCSIKNNLSNIMKISNNFLLEEILLYHGYSHTLLRLAALCCLLFMVLGLLGNSITIIALLGCKKVSI